MDGWALAQPRLPPAQHLSETGTRGLGHRSSCIPAAHTGQTSSWEDWAELQEGWGTGEGLGKTKGWGTGEDRGLGSVILVRWDFTVLLVGWKGRMANLQFPVTHHNGGEGMASIRILIQPYQIVVNFF